MFGCSVELLGFGSPFLFFHVSTSSTNPYTHVQEGGQNKKQTLHIKISLLVMGSSIQPMKTAV